MTAHEQDGPRRASAASDPEAFAGRLAGQLQVARRRRRLPAVALCALLGLFLAAAAGAAFSVLAVHFGLRVAGDLASRLLVFIASAVSLLYVVVHACGARRRFTKTPHGPPWIYGNYVHAAALLLSRLGFALWIAAIVTTALLLSTVGVGPATGLAEQSIYLNLVICIVGFISLSLVIYCIEISPTPFKVAVLTQSSFLADRPAVEDEKADLSVSGRASLEKAERLAEEASQPPKGRFFRWTWLKKPKTFMARRPTGSPDQGDDEFEFMRGSPEQASESPGPLRRTPVSPMPIGIVVAMDPHPGQLVLTPEIQDDAEPEAEGKASAAATLAHAPSISERRLTGPPSSFIRRKPVPSMASLVPPVPFSGLQTAAAVGEPQTPKTPIDMVREANHALSTYLASPMFQRPESRNSDTSVYSLPPSPSYAAPASPVRPRTAPDAALHSHPVYPVHSASSSITSIIAKYPSAYRDAPIHDNHNTNNNNTNADYPAPISLALVTSIIKRRSSEFVARPPSLLRASRIGSGAGAPWHPRDAARYSAFEQIDEVDTPIDSPPPVLTNPFRAVEPRPFDHWPRATADADDASTAGVTGGLRRMRTTTGIVEHAPDALGLSRTARRLRKTRLEAANAGIPKRSYSNFSRPLRRTHTVSGSTASAASSSSSSSTAAGSSRSGAGSITTHRRHSPSSSLTSAPPSPLSVFPPRPLPLPFPRRQGTFGPGPPALGHARSASETARARRQGHRRSVSEHGAAARMRTPPASRAVSRRTSAASSLRSYADETPEESGVAGLGQHGLGVAARRGSGAAAATAGVSAVERKRRTASSSAASVSGRRTSRPISPMTLLMLRAQAGVGEAA